MKTIILSSLALLLFSACSSEPAQEKTTQSVSEPKVEAVKEATKNVESLNALAEENTTQAKIETKPKTEPVSAVKVEQKVEKKADADAPNGATLYANKCASCHGKDGKKSALNNSAAIAGWESERLITVLKGYKDGSYGGKMKAIMQGQSKPLSDTEIELLSHYISTL